MARPLKSATTSSGYCTVDCDEMTDELGPDALCAYHRDHQEKEPAK